MQSSAMTYITLGTLENFTVPLPSEEEQQKSPPSSQPSTIKSPPKNPSSPQPASLKSVTTKDVCMSEAREIFDSISTLDDLKTVSNTKKAYIELKSVTEDVNKAKPAAIGDFKLRIAKEMCALKILTQE